MIVNKNKIMVQDYCNRIKGLKEFLKSKKYDWVYLPSRDKYQIELDNIIVELYTDESLEFCAEIKTDASLYCGDFIELINELIKNDFIVEEKINEKK